MWGRSLFVSTIQAKRLLMNPARLSELEEKWLNGSISPAERAEYAQWYNAFHEEEPLELEGDEASLEQRMMRGIYAKAGLADQTQAPVQPLHRTTFLGRWRWAAAAVFILVCTATWWMASRKAGQQTSAFTASVLHDVKAPAAKRALLRTADGKTVVLDEIGAGAIGEISGAFKTGDGNLVFDAHATAVQMRTLVNPRGSKSISVTLPDGTIAWLNAASTLEFPSVFNGNERLVTLTGEGYFEAMHDNSKPFRVKAGKEIIEDLGTKFNVKAYDDEPGVRATLVEGAVKVRGQVLRPGQQAVLRDKMIVLSDVEMDDVLAWREEKFRYHSVDVKTALKEAARWYDVQVDFEGEIGGTISGGTPRGVNLSEFVNMLSYSGKLKFEIEGQKLIVRPANNK